MIKQMPFSFLKLYFNGERIQAVAVAGGFELQGDGFVLAGMDGKPYTFASIQTAEFWLQHNLMLSAQPVLTPQSAIERLERKKAKVDAAAWYWLDEEIAAITNRNGTMQNTMNAWPKWLDLFIDGGFA